MDLFEEDSGSEDSEEIKINTENNYAERYDNWRQKEHLQKLKDKYGEDVEEESEESDDESEDSEAEEMTEEVEKDFYATLSSLKSKDPKIYDGETEFFKKNEQAEESSSKEKKVAKVTLADMERKVELIKWRHLILLLRGGGVPLFLNLVKTTEK